MSLLVLPMTLPGQTGSAFFKKECPCIAPFSTFTYSFKKFEFPRKQETVAIAPELYLGVLLMDRRYVIGGSLGIHGSVALHGGLVFGLNKKK